MINVEDMIKDIKEQVKHFETEQILVHGGRENIDQGDCGGATTVIEFGRKQKLKKLLKSHGLISKWWGTGAMRYSFSIPAGTVGIYVQSMDYNTKLHSVVTEVVKKYIGDHAKVYNESWID